MVEAFLSGGIVMWPLLIIGIGVLVLALRVGWLLLDPDRAEAEAGGSLQAIPFWGAMGAVLGLLGAVVGIIQITQAISLAGEVHPALVWGGFGLALLPLIFGLLIFLVAAVLWFVLRQWSLRIASRARQHPAPA